MSVVLASVRSGEYHDSVVLMQLRVRLLDEPGVEDAGVVMATDANLDILRASDLLPPSLGATQADDLLIALRAVDQDAAETALGRVDDLLARRGSADSGGDAVLGGYRPHGLEGALRVAPEARWALVSVPGRHAAKVASDALSAGLNVFLYSDNVALEDEVRLKREAAKRGLLVLGPDCGTAVLGGSSFGFANRVEPGPVGIVSASGTGLQAVACQLDALGVGVSQAIGTGGRDVSDEVGGLAAYQALEWLGRDPHTGVIALVGKPPAPSVLPGLLAAAQQTGKPVVVHFQGSAPPPGPLGRIRFEPGLTAAARAAAELAGEAHEGEPPVPPAALTGAVRGFFAGGTLAGEMAAALAWFLDPLEANVSARGARPVADLTRSTGHTVLDLGDDAFTVGRLHPMIDPALRLERLAREARDEEVDTLLLDVVLGDGAALDPAADLAPVVREAVDLGRRVIAIVVGSSADPQDLEAQCAALEEAGAEIHTDPATVASRLFERFAVTPREAALEPVSSAELERPKAVINFGLESFGASFDDDISPAVRVIQVEWRPPAGGNEELAALLERMGR